MPVTLLNRLSSPLLMPPVGGLPRGNQAVRAIPGLGSQLQLWLDASQASSYDISGGNVATWRDLSGRATTATRAAGTIVDSSATQNGKKGITFSASGYMTIPGVALGTYPWTLIVVGRTTNLASPNSILGASGSGGLQFRLDTTGALQLVKESVAAIGSSSGTVTSGTTFIGVLQASATNYSFNLNGGAQTTGTQSNTLSATTGNLGRNGSSSNEFLIGTIFELALTNSYLTQAVLSKVVQPLNAKWAVY